MKNRKFYTLLIIVLLLFISTDLFAIRTRKDYFQKPQIGFWLGPITPIFKTGDLLETDVGAGAFVRFNTWWSPLKIGVDTSYNHFESEGVNELLFVPVYGSFIYLLPLNLPVKLQLKLGGGGGYVEIHPDSSSQWDPLFTIGFELSFSAGRIFNVALRIDYFYLYEGYVTGVDKWAGGHILNAGISLYFNINL